ncbi:MAG: AAA family ATPase [Planctomycetota bacterium]
MSLQDMEWGDLVGRTFLCAVDQRPFESYGNKFCVLTPLVSAEGERVDEPRERLFPNRGRIWWMLRRELDERWITPGVVLTVQLERAVEDDSDRPDKDLLQARRDLTVLGSNSYLEVIRLDHDPEVGQLLDGAGIPWERPTISRVLVAGPKNVVGPWAADWSPDGRVRLKALIPGRPLVWRASLKKLGQTILDVGFTANGWDKRFPEVTIRVGLAHESILETLEQIGEGIDAADDHQVMNWALKRMGYSRSEQQRIKAIIERASEAATEEEAPPGRMDRFRKICASADRVMGLGADVAKELTSHEAFQHLIEENLENVLEERLSREVESRRATIERQTRELEEKCQDIQKDLARLDEEYAEKDRQLEAELRQSQARRAQELEDRERALEVHLDRLAEQEHRLNQRAEALQEKFEERNEAIYQRLLDDLPILMRIRQHERPAISESDERVERGDWGERDSADSTELLPTFLARPRECGGLTESELLDQFQRVARYRGFVFERDDLANIHIAAKVGLWTVLAGPSGTGKSSLPRLYAEALGVQEEQLFVSVRPDWMDDRDVLGGFNSLSGRYEPAASGLVNRLIAAYEDERAGRGGLYLICLDEMNLSRVEHYFAHFLSVMERPATSRSVELYAASLGSAADPYAAYRHLPIGDNVRFIGTVNIDETSYFFSPRVIDRASLIVLEEPDLSGSVLPENDRDRLGGLQPVHRSEYESWIRSHDQAKESVRAFVMELDEVLRRGRSGLAHRTFRRFLRYVASAESLLDEDRAFDLAFAQIVIPRLKQSAVGFSAMIDGLRQKMTEGRFPRSATLLERLIEAQGDYDFFQLL